MRIVVRIIDFISEWTGSLARWLGAFIVIVLVYESVARFVFNAPTIWAYETASMLGVAFIVLGLAYTHRHHAHIRIDVLYSRVSPRGKVIIDLICTLLLFFPLMILITRAAAQWALDALTMHEKMLMSFWMPPASPIRVTVFLGLALFTIQGVAEFIRDIYFLIKAKPL